MGLTSPLPFTYFLEEPGVDPLLHNQHSQLGVVICTKVCKTLHYLSHFIVFHDGQLAITNTITVHDDLLRFPVVDLHTHPGSWSSWAHASSTNGLFKMPQKLIK